MTGARESDGKWWNRVHNPGLPWGVFVVLFFEVNHGMEACC